MFGDNINKKTFTLLIFAVVVVLMLSELPFTSNSSQTPATTSPSGTFIMGTPLSGTIDNLNPLTVDNDVATSIDKVIYSDSLGHMESNGSLMPWLANSWNITYLANGSESITYHLNDKACWFQGDKAIGHITSRDILFTFDVIKANATLDGNGIDPYLYNISASNNYTVTLSFNSTSLMWLIYTSTQVIIPHQWATYDKGNLSNIGSYTDMAKSCTDLITAGPFYLSSQNSQGAIMKAEQGFWLGSPKIAKFYLEEFKSTTDMTEALETGTIDAEFPSLSVYDHLKTVSGINNVIEPEPWTFFLWVNNVNAPFNNVHVRRGMAYAINKTQVMIKAEDGLGSWGAKDVSFGGLPTVLQSYWASNLTYYSYNPSLAKAEFEKAGYHIGTNGYFVNNTTGQTLNATIVEPSISDWDASATFITNDLKAVGFDVTYKVVPISTWATDVFTEKNFHYMTYFGFVPAFTNAYYTLYQLYYTYDGNYNVETYSNSTIDHLLNESLVAKTTGQQKAYMDKIQKAVDSAVPIIPIGNAYNYYAYSTSKITGFNSNYTMDSPINLMNIHVPTTTPKSSFNIYYIIAGIVAVIAVISALGIFMSKKKAKRDE